MKSLKVWGCIVTLLGIAIIISSCVISTQVGSETKAQTKTETEPIIVLSDEERTLMARVLYNEAGSNSIKLMRYCASVMVNQLNSPWYGDTITEVLSRRNAYVGYSVLDTDVDNSIKDGANLSVVLSVVDEICTNGSILPEDIWFFRAGEGFTWEGLQTYEIVEGVYFQYFDQQHIAAGWH